MGGENLAVKTAATDPAKGCTKQNIKPQIQWGVPFKEKSFGNLRKCQLYVSLMGVKALQHEKNHWQAINRARSQLQQIG